MYWSYLIHVDYNKIASTKWYNTLEFPYFQCFSREHKWLVAQNEIWSFRDPSRSQEELLQVLLPAALDVSLHFLTWLLCRQSQLWVQVRTVVSIYSAFVLLSASTDPVQTNTCGQMNKDVKTKSTAQEVISIIQVKQENDSAQIPLHCIFFYNKIYNHIFWIDIISFPSSLTICSSAVMGGLQLFSGALLECKT